VKLWTPTFQVFLVLALGATIPWRFGVAGKMGVQDFRV
jgi:hypothetical protein